MDFVRLQKNFWGVRRTHKLIFDHQKILPQGVFLTKNRDFYKFLPISAKYPMGFPEIPYRLWGHMGPTKAVAPQKVCAHTRHTFFEASKYLCFRSTKRQLFDEKKFLCVPYGCKYSFGARQIILAEKLGARRQFYIPWILFVDKNSCLHNCLKLGTFQVFWEFWDSTFHKPFRMKTFLVTVNLSKSEDFGGSYFFRGVTLILS